MYFEIINNLKFIFSKEGSITGNFQSYIQKLQFRNSKRLAK